MGTGGDLDEDWSVACSDDELYGKDEWEPDLAEIKDLYEKLAKGETLTLEWQVPERRSPHENDSDEEMEQEEEAPSEEKQEALAPTEFDFDDDMSMTGAITPRRTPGSKTPRRTEKRVARMDKIMSDLMRHKRIDKQAKQAQLQLQKQNQLTPHRPLQQPIGQEQLLTTPKQPSTSNLPTSPSVTPPQALSSTPSGPSSTTPRQLTMQSLTASPPAALVSQAGVVSQSSLPSMQSYAAAQAQLPKTLPSITLPPPSTLQPLKLPPLATVVTPMEVTAPSEAVTQPQVTPIEVLPVTASVTALPQPPAVPPVHPASSVQSLAISAPPSTAVTSAVIRAPLVISQPSAKPQAPLPSISTVTHPIPKEAEMPSAAPEEPVSIPVTTVPETPQKSAPETLQESVPETPRKSAPETTAIVPVAPTTNTGTFRPQVQPAPLPAPKSVVPSEPTQEAKPAEVPRPKEQENKVEKVLSAAESPSQPQTSETVITKETVPKTDLSSKPTEKPSETPVVSNYPPKDSGPSTREVVTTAPPSKTEATAPTAAADPVPARPAVKITIRKDQIT